MSDLGLGCGISQYTRIETKGQLITQTCIDHVFTRLASAMPVYTATINEPIADHRIIACTIMCASAVDVQRQGHRPRVNDNSKASRLITIFNNKNVSQQLSQEGSVYQYADDTCIIVANRDVRAAERMMQANFDTLCKWAHDLGLVINIKKTKAMHIHSAHNKAEYKAHIVAHAHDCLHGRIQHCIYSELEELGEQLPRYRPDSIAALRRLTRFTEPELKRLYRGFKAECPTGVVREETFKLIYSQFFPQGANTAQYAHYVFNTLDQDRSGLLSFEEFVTGLSILSRGTLEEKLRWTFSLYDINGDGFITKEEMTEIVTAIYDLMGKIVEPMVDEEVVRDKVERLFQKMDSNRDGVLTLDEFLDCCVRDEGISRSMGVFDSNF
ncbi:Kv channel-interacting protein 4-like [Pararge aegeria]|uniref:Kv channel-interacting protein 4-like n=1 Tax=Pararge aegeria TaxID=116150 RepID=UPI0019D1D759|nr:Kv channel-interacting protein 4-like [Pararge aegeria]